MSLRFKYKREIGILVLAKRLITSTRMDIKIKMISIILEKRELINFWVLFNCKRNFKIHILCILVVLFICIS